MLKIKFILGATCLQLGSHDSLATGKRKFHQLHVCSTADSIALWDHFELRADQIQGRGNTEIHIWIDAQIQGQSSAKCEVRPGTHFVTWAPSTDRWVASIREEERVHVYMCVRMYLYISGCRCVYVFIWSGPPGYENMRQRLRWFPKSPTHQVAPQQTNKDSGISMFKGFAEKRQRLP